MTETSQQRESASSGSSFFTPPSLPKGGGALTGSGGALSAGGPDGVAGWSIPLPVSAGRGFAPELALGYSSAGGNSEFGLGWQLSVPAIRRDTRLGVPKYDADDRISGPDGQELLRVGAPQFRTALPFSALAGEYRVTVYWSRTGGPVTRTECWEEQKDAATVRTFWIAFSPDGGLALYGWSPQARLSDPADAARIAEWRLEEQVTARGEHILWRWRHEDDTGCDAAEKAAHPAVSGCYPDRVLWANTTPSLSFSLPEKAGVVTENDWLCVLLLDYGERGISDVITAPPPFAPGAGKAWPVRPDAFSRWRYGFEVRTRRLCRACLLFHRPGLMAGETDATPELVSHLHLTHETSPSVSWLAAAQVFGYDPDAGDAPVTTPPVEFNLTQPAPLPDQSAAWQYRADLDGFSYQRWQMADLAGEGLTGLLYQDAGGWWYRAPVRDAREGAEPDAITWSTPGAQERIPSMPGLQLVDLNGDGRPESVVSLPGVTGSFTLGSGGHWRGFVPFSALPSEFSDPRAQLTDLAGVGLSDLVMVGPRSVRLWPSDGTNGWRQALSERYCGARPLPVGDTEDSMVLFSDIPGSGQQHLTEITAAGVSYWPSLGHGRFGEAVSVDGFSVPAGTFSPGRVYLADIDGSGTPDILYLEHDGIRVFSNESGNRFVAAGVIPLPEGVHGDELCSLQAADIQGLGMASLLLTVPHGPQSLAPRSWLLNLNTVKPWLLNEVVDNLGGRTLLEYRSSAQGWLDEKAERLLAGESAPVSYLPFPVHTVHRITQVNEITGLTLGSETRYLGGVWDGQEREFAGFTRLVRRDTHQYTTGTAAEISLPAEVRSWFMTGLQEHDAVLKETYTGMKTAIQQNVAGRVAEAPDLLAPKPVRFTRRDEQAGEDEVFTPDDKTQAWLRRALRGAPVRTETYGLDGSSQEGIPYSVSTQRWQIRAYETAEANKPSALAVPVESLSATGERIPEDPVLSQSILLTQDKYGNALESVTLNYPRRLSPAALVSEEAARTIYPASLPAGTIRESTDTQQYDCWLNLTRTTVHSLDTATDFVTGLPDAVRTDVIWYGTTHPEGNPDGRANHPVPEGGFSVEFLLYNTGTEAEPLREIDRLLAITGSVAMTGYSKTHWRSAADGETLQDKPDRQALVAFTETAMHDKQSLDVLRPVFDQTLRDLVTEVLNDTTGQKDPAALTRVRGRMPQAIDGRALYTAFVDATRDRQREREVLSVLRGMVKERVETPVLLRYVLDAPADIIPDGKKKAIDPEGGVPAEWLWYAVDAFIRDAGADTQVQQAVLAELDAQLPDSLFWQAVTGAEGGLPGMNTFLDQRVQEETLEQLLARGGYHPVTVPFLPAVTDVRSGHHNHTVYYKATDKAFWLPKTVRDSDLVRATELTYTGHWLAVKQATDGVSHFTAVEAFDWRFLSPVRVRDINDNITEAKLDALGRTVWSRFYGTETPVVTDEATGERRLSDTPVEVGYSPFTDIAFIPPATVDAALALNTTKGVPVHEAFTLVTDSWMPLGFDGKGHPDGQRCGELARRRRAQQLARDGISTPALMDGRTPPHVIRIQTDRYDSDPEQQVRVQVMLSGGGQVLQTAILNPAGEAFVRTAAGGLETGSDGKAVTAQADVRWAVTGKTEFDNKGQAIRVWLPFYLNDWRWVSDDSARDGIYADTHVYDAVGREYKVIRAAGEAVELASMTVKKEDEQQLVEALAVILAEGERINIPVIRKNEKTVAETSTVFLQTGEPVGLTLTLRSSAAGVLVTAALTEWANYERRVQVYPWFTVQEDENDTWQAVLERAYVSGQARLDKQKQRLKTQNTLWPQALVISPLMGQRLH